LASDAVDIFRQAESFPLCKLSEALGNKLSKLLMMKLASRSP